MSDPYNQYPSQGQYGHSPAPSGGGYGAPPYQQQQGYDQNYQQHQQQQGYNQGYNSPAPSDHNAYGPPAAGGFEYGVQRQQVAPYDASNQGSNAGYYGEQQQHYPNHDPSQQHMQPYQQQGQYGQPQQGQYDPNAQGQYRDPNAPPGSEFHPPGAEGAEGERGLGTALAGGAAGYFLGRKKNHGFLGAVGGAIAGNFLGNKFKEHNSHGGGHHGSQHGGGSNWGGGRW